MRVYRLVLDTTDALAGSTWNDARWAINTQLQDPAKDEVVTMEVVVESIDFHSSAGAPSPFLVIAPTLPLKFPPFWSKTHGQKNVLCVASGGFYVNPVTTQTVGHAMTEVESVFRTQVHEIKIVDPATGVPMASGSSLDYTIVLAFIIKSATD